ncbi:zinc finger CCCH domain-containing protein 13 [Artemisia annua]|uniref:Zinc finger CCCH domain-containing protein 13 n=1 Tax=Artemisia annua TaxID=35608 RepID=A0A2U1LWU4_ARTAN|nr:zinc finger CCCH domain-containing protein 13 [Artemisia annua]
MYERYPLCNASTMINESMSTFILSCKLVKYVELLKNKLGFDEAFNYKEESDLEAALASDQDHRKRQRFDGESDYSGRLRISDWTERQSRDRKPSSTEFQVVHDAQIYLEESTQKAESLKSKIEELEKSQARLQRLGEQLGLDVGATANEDEIGIDTLRLHQGWINIRFL